MRHPKAGQETIDSLQHKTPSIMMIGSKQHLNFKDVFYNLLLNNLQGMDYDKINRKVETLTTQPMSHKHRKRLVKQLKKKIGLKTEGYKT